MSSDAVESVRDAIADFERGYKIRLAIYSAITWVGLIGIWIALVLR